MEQTRNVPTSLMRVSAESPTVAVAGSDELPASCAVPQEVRVSARATPKAAVVSRQRVGRKVMIG